MSEFVEKIKAHGNNIAWWHTIFDLPFAFMGALLATNGNPEPIVLFWIALAVSTGRAATMAIDNLADLDFDKKQDRLSYRAMVSGKISNSESMQLKNFRPKVLIEIGQMKLKCSIQ